MSWRVGGRGGESGGDGEGEGGGVYKNVFITLPTRLFCFPLRYYQKSKCCGKYDSIFEFVNRWSILNENNNYN